MSPVFSIFSNAAEPILADSLLIKLIGPSEIPSYEKLVLESYSRAKGFKIHPTAALWSIEDEVFFPLGVFNSNQEILACMRLEYLLSKEQIDLRLHSKISAESFKSPSVYLAKGATQQGLQGQGFNALLRLFCIAVAKEWKAIDMYGTMVEHSPRIETMKKLGYEFSPCDQEWSHQYKSSAKTLYAKMNMKDHAATAISILTGELQSLLQKTRLSSDLIKMRPRNQQEVQERVWRFQTRQKSILESR
jgi:hypothetical protein